MEQCIKFGQAGISSNKDWKIWRQDMKKWMTILFDMLKVFILFTAFTLFFYYAIIWINLEYDHQRRYEEPEGSALKVTNMVEENQDHWYHRLIFFYLHGE